MSKLVSKKSLIVCLAVSLVLIIAGAFVAGFLHFNGDSTMRDYEMIEVYDYYTLRTDESKDSLESFVKSELEKNGFKVGRINCTEEEGVGNVWEFVVSGDKSASEFAVALQGSIQGKEDIGFTDPAIVTVSYHKIENAPYYEYIWRTAIGASVAVVLVFAYVAIRFRVGMGLTAFVAAVHDVLLTLAVVALLRIPVGVAFIGVAAFSLLLSAVLNLTVFGRMRADFRSEERKNLPAREGVALSIKDSVKSVFTVCILVSAAIVALGVIGIVVGFDLASLMLAALMAVVVSAYSSLLLSPAIFACIKERTDAARAKKSKYNYETEKKKEKAAKAAEKQEPAGESN